MKQAMISTWKMSYDGMIKAKKYLKQDIKQAIITAIQEVENCEDFISVGHGGLPNALGHIQLDAAYMDGNRLSFGGIIEAENIKSPIALAAKLSEYKVNCLLSGKGAESFAKEHHFEFEDHLTIKAKKRWEEQCLKKETLKAYEGHDTVCVLAKSNDQLAAGVSTSGLFMKHDGRVGDSPIIGSGFYCDANIGSAAATGLGEDIMRGCLSIRIVDAMANGLSAQEAADRVLDRHMQRMKQAQCDCDAISVIAMNKDGSLAASTNLEAFPFVITEEEKTTLMVASYQNGKHQIFEADEHWLKQYTGD